MQWVIPDFVRVSDESSRFRMPNRSSSEFIKTPLFHVDSSGTPYSSTDYDEISHEVLFKACGHRTNPKDRANTICIFCSEEIPYCIGKFECFLFMKKQHEPGCKRYKCGYCKTKRSIAYIQRCSGCKKTYYCNAQCQQKNWKLHKKKCH
jgi:hypothetical protein